MFAKSSASLVAALAIVLSLAASASAAGLATGSYSETLLSNEIDTSRWAFISETGASAWSRPGNRGRKLIRLSRATPDGTSELVETLRERVYSDGTVWTEARLPMRGKDVRGWIDRGKLDKYRVIHTRIEIDRKALTAKVFKRNALVWQGRVGVGSNHHRTPAGSFFVRNRLASSDPKFGPFALGLSAKSKSGTDWPGGSTVGIHGTDRPRTVPGHTKDPCIRLKNSDIKKLFRLTPPGTPVKIT